jgi:hypothetical protein
MSSRPLFIFLPLVASLVAIPCASAQTSKNTALVQSTRKPVAGEEVFVVILQSSLDPSEQLKASIPADLQETEVFTIRRSSEGLTLHDIALGYFATMAHAESAQRLLLKRFPNASIVPFHKKPVP